MAGEERKYWNTDIEPKLGRRKSKNCNGQKNSFLKNGMNIFCFETGEIEPSGSQTWRA
jgi:hypothetical protein